MARRTAISGLAIWALLAAAHAPRAQQLPVNSRRAAPAMAGFEAGTAERESQEVYRQRRAALEKELSDGPIVLFGNREPSGSEAYHVFRQESNFYYLTGYDEPGAALLLAFPVRNQKSSRLETSSRLPIEILFLPPRDPEEEQWTGPQLDPSDPATAARLGIAATEPMEQLYGEVRRFSRDHRAVYTLLPSPHAAEEDDLLERRHVESLRSLLPSAEIKDARRAIGALRQVKSGREVQWIQRAADCTMAGLRAAAHELRPGMFEYEIAALLKYTFERQGCQGLAFDPIVASGIRSTILHYIKDSSRMESGDMVVMDVGAEYAHYAADITRTLPVNGRFTPRQREIYDIVLGAQQAAMDAMKPGMKIGGHGPDSLYQIAFDYIDTHGKDIHGNSLGRYFTHGLSHHVGLDVHDAGDPGRILETGMVVTLEPGIYLPEENFGVRIEDMALVTKNGYELLTRQLPRKADDIEKLMEQ